MLKKIVVQRLRNALGGLVNRHELKYLLVEIETKKGNDGEIYVHGGFLRSDQTMLTVNDPTGITCLQDD